MNALVHTGESHKGHGHDPGDDQRDAGTFQRLGNVGQLQFFSNAGHQRNRDRKAHAAYNRKLAELIKNKKQGKENVVDELLIFLSEWWSKHVTASDLKYARYSCKRKSKKH